MPGLLTIEDFKLNLCTSLILVSRESCVEVAVLDESLVFTDPTLEVLTELNSVIINGGRWAVLRFFL
jgi:hypothetical protein